MSDQHEEPREGAPEWMVSYADMITIMMAFFVVLYASTGASGSRDKGGKAGQQPKGGKEASMGSQSGVSKGDSAKDATEERLQKVFDSLYYRFGPEWTLSNCWLGGPAALHSSSSAQEDDQHRQTGRPSRVPKQNPMMLVAPKPNDNVVAGGRVFFDEGAAALNDGQKIQLRALARELAGKMQKIEIRGHTCRRPLPRGSPFRDHWDLAYARCRAVYDLLVAEGIDPRRVRLGVAGENEPSDTDDDALQIKQNSRVEIHQLNEWVKEPTASQRTPKATVAAAAP
jgi:chemotaxis protein MotB